MSFSTGAVEGVPFTVCATGSEIIILDKDFTPQQQIETHHKKHQLILDFSTDVGRFAVASGTNLTIYDSSQNQDYKWEESKILESDFNISTISFNLEGNKLITGGSLLQLWVYENNQWKSVWRTTLSRNVKFLKYSPDGTVFCSAGHSDRRVKIWYDLSNYKFSFLYIAHPLPITCLEWRRTSKYTPKDAVANMLITSCRDDIARIWVQTIIPGMRTSLHFHLAGVIECDSEHMEEDESHLVVHWVNNKEIHITRSIELVLHDLLMRILKCNNQKSSSTNSPQSAEESCSGSDNNIDDIDAPNDDTITAESSKKLRHKLCRKMNKQRALAASGRRDLTDFDDNSGQTSRASYQNNAVSDTRANQKSIVEEFDKTLELLMKKWQMSSDLVFSINKKNGTLTLWQVRYLDGEDTNVFRQVQVDDPSRLNAALPNYDASTMSLHVTAYSPSVYSNVKRAFLAATSNADSELASDILIDDQNIQANATTEPNIFIVTQHLSGILGLWKLGFGTSYPQIQNLDLVTRITGLPIDPAWLRDGILTVQYMDQEENLVVSWIADEIRSHYSSNTNNHSNSDIRQSMPLSQAKSNLYSFDEVKSNFGSHPLSLDEDSGPKTRSSIHDLSESQVNIKDSYRASQMANEVAILPQYHIKQLIELLAFGKLQKVKAILNHLVNCLVKLDNENDHDEERDGNSPEPWAQRSRKLSIFAQKPPSFQDSFDNPSIQRQVIEEIELDYNEVTSIKPLPLYSILEAEKEKQNVPDTKVSKQEEFSTSYESILRARSQVDETLDEILGQSAIDTMKKQKELKRLASDDPERGSLTSFNPNKARLLTQVLTHTRLPDLTNIDQMHLLALADAVAFYDASPDDLHNGDQDDSSNRGAGMLSTNIAIDSLDDRGLRFLTAMRQHVYLTRCLPMKQRTELKMSGIGSHNIVWAFQSETQDELVSLIPCVQRNKPEWSELREFGVGWWLKKLEVLKKLMEKVAQAAYQAKQDPLDAALYYLAMKKKTLVCGLLRRVNCDKRILKLFELDFNDPVNRKKALKNAYALLGLHRFEHAAAFFILAGSIWGAVEVCINNLNDFQLAMVLIRLHDSGSNTSDNLQKLLSTEVLVREEDPFLRSMTYWKLSDHASAASTLLDSQKNDRLDISSVSVLSYYLFLKEHGYSSRTEETADKEQGLFFAAAKIYLEAGCPLLALEVLNSNAYLNVGQAQRMKFVACIHVLMNELRTLAKPGLTSDEFENSFSEWFQKSVDTLREICSYASTENDPLLRAALTYCNIHSATENNLSAPRQAILKLLKIRDRL